MIDPGMPAPAVNQDTSGSTAITELQTALDAIAEFTEAVSLIENAVNRAVDDIERKRVTASFRLGLDTLKNLGLITRAKILAINGDGETPGINQARDIALTEIADKQSWAIKAMNFFYKDIALKAIQSAKERAIQGDEETLGINQVRDAALQEIGNTKDGVLDAIRINRTMALWTIENTRDTAIQKIEDAKAQSENFAKQFEAAMRRTGARIER